MLPGAPSAASCCAKMRPAADDAVQAGKRGGEADGALAESIRRPVCAGRQGRSGGGAADGGCSARRQPQWPDEKGRVWRRRETLFRVCKDNLHVCFRHSPEVRLSDRLKAVYPCRHSGRYSLLGNWIQRKVRFRARTYASGQLRPHGKNFKKPGGEVACRTRIFLRRSGTWIPH